MVNCILNLLIVVLGLSAVLGILYFLLGYELKEKKYPAVIATAVLFILVATANLFINNKEISEVITEVALLGAAMGLPYILLKSKKRLVFVWFGLIICSTFDYLETLILSFVLRPSAYSVQIIYIILYTVVLLVILSVYRFTRLRVPPNFLEQLSPTIYIVIFFADFAAYYQSMLSKDSQYFSEVSDILNLLSASLIAVCFSYIVYRYAALSNKQKESELQLEAELKHYEEMVQKNRDIRTFRHDYKNNLYSIKALVSSGRTAEAQKYIDDLRLDVELSENRYSTGNYLADAIISAKADEAKKYEVDIAFEGMIPKEGISNSDLCTVISNSLDNAIRGCEGSSPCTINILSEKLKNGIKFTVSNPVRENVKIKNNNVKTTKKDVNNHGIGLANIRRAVQKYNGYADISCENGIFKIEIGIIIQ